MQRLVGAAKSIAVQAAPRRRTAAASFSTSFLFDETQIRFKESLQQFVQEKIAPHADKIDKMDCFPLDVNLWKAMGDFDLHGLTAPAEYGGLDVGYLYHCMAMEEISRASASVGVSYGVHSNVCLNQLRLVGAAKSIAVQAAPRRRTAAASFSTSFLFDETQIRFKESLQQFVQEKIAPHADKIDKMDCFPLDVNLWKAMGDFDLHGLTAPAEYGGLDVGYLYHCMAMEEISRASASVGVSYGVHSNVCLNQLVRHGNAAQKEKYIPKLVNGEHVGALSISEPNSGSDAVGIKCKADRVDGGYVINGNKMWCTNGTIADTLVVYAKTDVSAGSKGITAFIVEKGTPGFTTAQKLDKLGMRGSGTCELVFENCFVPIVNVLGEVGKGVYIMMSGLDLERIVLAAAPIGIMQACLDVVLPYVRQREQFGRPIGEFQLMEGKLADMYVALQSSRSYVYSVARDCDNGNIVTKDCAGAILVASERSTQVALQAIQCLGGNGYMNEYPTGRFLRDAKLYEIGAGTSEIRRMLIGRQLFKEQ